MVVENTIKEIVYVKLSIVRLNKKCKMVIKLNHKIRGSSFGSFLYPVNKHLQCLLGFLVLGAPYSLTHLSFQASVAYL